MGGAGKKSGSPVSRRQVPGRNRARWRISHEFLSREYRPGPHAQQKSPSDPGSSFTDAHPVLWGFGSSNAFLEHNAQSKEEQSGSGLRCSTGTLEQNAGPCVLTLGRPEHDDIIGPCVALGMM